MTQDALRKPAARDAESIVRDVLGNEPATVQRFRTGLCHHVFDVLTSTGQRVVIRIAEPTNRHYLVGAVYWSKLLRPKGIPLPRLLAADVDGDRAGFPFMIMERMPGTDLGEVYAGLSMLQKQRIVCEVVKAQQLAGTLPEASGFGHATSYGEVPHRTWSDVIACMLERSRSWIVGAGIVDPRLVERVAAVGTTFEPYFAQVRPTAFLDDTTTKNVIVHGGRLTGIVDVDEVCFGDPLLTPALTRMALLASDHPTDYVDLWCRELNLDDTRRAAMTFYTALFCVNFLGELGQTFNADRPPPVDMRIVVKRTAILEELLAELEGF